MRKRRWFAVLLVVSLTGCIRTQPEIVIVTQMPDPGVSIANNPPLVSSQGTVTSEAIPDLSLLTVPTPDPTRSIEDGTIAREYVVQPGDTLSSIAAANQISLDTLLSVNALEDPNLLVVGQVIQLPEPPATETSSFKIVPDSRLVRAPGSSAFDVREFVNRQPGYIRLATDTVEGDLLSAADVIQRVSLEFSVDARLLLAVLEYRAHWLSQAELDDEVRIHPLGAGPNAAGVERAGLYRQLTWAADQLNAGYYGWKYRGLTTLEFEQGERLRFAPVLNAATVGVQVMLSQFNNYTAWVRDVSPAGLYQTYQQYFGDPFAGAVDPVVPPGMSQPTFDLPFGADEVWFYTGGPHGGWGSGSAWSAIDFAPPDDLTEVDTACYISQHWARAVAAGVIARTAVGVVVLDLDGDGDESTGWSVLYLHIAGDGQIAAGTRVNSGDPIGRPSCQGGFSNGTHLHVARRFNGEWIPADCSNCPVEQAKAPFIPGGWQVVGIPGQEYQGFLVRGADQRVAEQGRSTPDNLVPW